MYRNQRLVYETHARRYFAQAVTILSSSIFVFTYSYINILLDGCEISEGGVFEFYLDIKLDASSGVCGYIYQGYAKFYNKPTGIILQIALALLLSLIPITIFLSTQKPHDCFVCLGKDPGTSTYSIF